MRYACLVLAACLLGSGAPAAAQPISFQLEIVVDSSAPVPGGSGSFSRFFPPSMSGASVVFPALDDAGDPGIYLFTGDALVLVANASTSIPGTTETFGAGLLGAPAISGDSVVFTAESGEAGAGPRSGVYEFSQQQLSRVVDTSTPAPGGTGAFAAFGFLSIEAGVVAFEGNSPAQPGYEGLQGNAGIYVLNELGALERAIDVSEPLEPGTRILTDVGHPVIRGDEVVFQGDTSLVVEEEEELLLVDTQSALFLISDGELLELALARSNGISFLADTIAIRDVGTNATIAFADGGQRVVADTSTPVPGVDGALLVDAASGGPWVTQDGIYFLGAWLTPGGRELGLFLDLEGELVPVVTTGQLLDGRTIDGLELRIGGFEHAPDGVAFRATFTDGSSAVVAAHMVPEPSALLLLLCAALALVWKRG